MYKARNIYLRIKRLNILKVTSIKIKVTVIKNHRNNIYVHLYRFIKIDCVAVKYVMNSNLNQKNKTFIMQPAKKFKVTGNINNGCIQRYHIDEI